MRTLLPHVHALTGAYVCHALEPGERRDVEQHLAECPDCATEVAELREAAALLAMSETRTPPPRLRAAVMAGIEHVRQLPPLIATPAAPAPARETSLRAGRVRGLGGLLTRPARPRAAGSVRAGWATAAVLAAVVAGLTFHETTGAPQAGQDTAISALLSAPDAQSGNGQVSGGGTVTVIDSRRRGEAEIILSALPAPPAGSSYQLWLIGTGSVRSVAVITTAGPTRSVLADHLGNATSMAITVEPAAGSTEPTTAPVLLMNLPA